jgi:hypothetical protein
MKVKGLRNHETMPQFNGNALVDTTDSRLTDARTPTAHGSFHKHGGAQEIATATPGANEIPKAGATGELADGWVSQSAVTQHVGALDHNATLNYDVAQHREINDAGSATTDLWSASKIQTELGAAQSNKDLKDSVETVADTNITLSGEQTLNGILTSTSRVGVVGQSTASENGIYITGAGAWTRATDADEDSDVTQGMMFMVADGDKKGWEYVLTTADPITVDTTALNFTGVPKVELGTTAGTACEGNDARLPTQDENDALAGTDGTPSSTNKVVTNSDPRNVNARTPTAHGLAGAEHTGSTFAALDALVTDKGLVAQDDAKLVDDRTASGVRTATTVVAVSSAAAPTAGQVLTAIGGTSADWQDPAASSDPTSDEATATADTTTVSASDVLVDSMTKTPAAGNYLVWFTGALSHSSNNAEAWASVYVGGAQEADSERYFRRGGGQGNVATPFTCVAKVTVNGSQAIEGRWRTSGATATMHERSLTILKVA